MKRANEKKMERPRAVRARQKETEPAADRSKKSRGELIGYRSGASETDGWAAGASESAARRVWGRGPRGRG